MLALVALVLFGTASSSKSSATNPGTSQIPRVAPVLSQLRPIALRTGPNSALDITYSPSSYGLAMSRSAIAIIRWNRNGTYRLVLSRRQPARAR